MLCRLVTTTIVTMAEVLVLLILFLLIILLPLLLAEVPDFGVAPVQMEYGDAPLIIIVVLLFGSLLRHLPFIISLAPPALQPFSVTIFCPSAACAIKFCIHNSTFCITKGCGRVGGCALFFVFIFFAISKKGKFCIYAKC